MAVEIHRAEQMNHVLGTPTGVLFLCLVRHD